MNTAKILYEQYKILPKKIKAELKALIDSENEEMIEISLPAFKEAVRDVKRLKEGKLKTKDAREFLKELENEA
jgi:hypothetical protein